jgi:L-seryl-tRNA(Ser) seleniumtransferase
MTIWGSRRGFFSWTRNAMAAASVSVATPGHAAVDTTRSALPGEDYYDKLGVAKIINAAGTYTALTASIMPPSVQAAVAGAARHPVRLAQLQKRAGEYIAGRLKCEAALVTSGASAALTLGTAACMTLGNRAATKLLPLEVSSLKNEVIIQKSHRFGYDQAVRNCGTRFVEVETLAQYEAAFTDRTVMCFFYNAAESGTISRQQWIAVSRGKGVPCFIDAAADVPPISNLWNYTQMGFDLVAFSGGKGLRGPQNAGLLLGRKDLIEAASWSNSPNSDTIGRGLKVAKEQVVGMVAAVDWILAQSDDALETEFRHRAERVAVHLKGVPTLSHEIFVPPVANAVPHLVLRYDLVKVGKAPLDVARILREGSPSIELHPATGRKDAWAGLPDTQNAIVVGVWMLQPGEDMIVARRLREVLS